MKIIAVFVVCVFILNAVAMGICSVVERYSPHVSLIAFLGFFILNMIIAWHMSVWITDRFLGGKSYRPAA